MGSTGECRPFLFEEIEQHRVPGDGHDPYSGADHRTHHPLCSGSSQPCHFIQDLLPPALANLMSTLVDGVRFRSVIIDSVEDPDVPQFVVEFGQSLIARHIIKTRSTSCDTDKASLQFLSIGGW